MTDPRTITRLETAGSIRLWIGVLTGPIAWSVQLASNWFMAEVVACAPVSPAQGMVGGLPLAVVVTVLDGILLAATLAAGLVALRCLRWIRREGDESAGRRSEWMARAGVVNSVTFAVVIAVSFAVVVLTRPCVS